MKISPSIVKMIMALLTIAILFVPAITMYEAEKQTVNRVLTLHGLYDEGDIIYLKNINKTEVELQFLNEIIIGSSSNNDSYVYADDNSVKELYYGNWVTYIGNGTYQVNYDKNEAPFTITELRWILGFPLDINGTTLATYDFIKVTMTGQDFPHPLWFKQWSLFPLFIGAYERLAWALDQNVNTPHIKLLIMTYGEKLGFTQLVDFNGYPDYNCYIDLASVPHIPESKEFGDGNFTFKIQAFNLNEEHQVFWEEEQLLYLSLGISISIMTVATAFSTNIIDIKAGKVK